MSDTTQLQRDLDRLLDEAMTMMEREVDVLQALRDVLGARIESSRSFLAAVGHLVETPAPSDPDSFDRLARQLQDALAIR